MAVTPVVTETVYALTGAELGPFDTVWPYATPDQVRVFLDVGLGYAPVDAATFALAPDAALPGPGAVTLSSALLPGGAWTAGAKLALTRATTAAQPAAFGSGLGFDPAAAEAALDNLARQIQEVRAALPRSVSLPFGEAAPLIAAAAERAGKFLGFDGETGAPAALDLPPATVDPIVLASQVSVATAPLAAQVAAKPSTLDVFNAVASGLGSAVLKASLNQEGGVPQISGGKIASSLVPAVNNHDFQTVANQAARLALVNGSDGGAIQPGAQVLQADVGYVYILGHLPPSVDGNWVATTSQTQITVNGKSGSNIQLGPDDVQAPRLDLSTSSYRVLADAAGLARSQPSRQSDAISLRDYCVGDGATDDTAGLNAWLAQLVASGRAGWVPKGKYKITTQPPVVTAPVSIYGEGYQHSELFFSNCGGLRFDVSNYTASTGTIVLSDLAIVTDQINIYQGLVVTGSNQIYTSQMPNSAGHAFGQRDLHMDRVVFRGSDLSFIKGWWIEVELIGVAESQINTCMFFGSNQSYYKSGVTGDGSVSNATYGVYIHGGSNNIQMINPHFYWKGVCHYTAQLNGEVGSEPGAIYGIQVQASLYGFVMVGGFGTGGPFVSGGSINVVLRGFVFGAPGVDTGGNYSAVWDVQILRNFGAGSLPFVIQNWYGIESYANHAWYHNNNIAVSTGSASYAGPSGTVNTTYNAGSVGYYIGGYDISLVDNKSQAVNTGIYLASSAHEILVTDNVYDVFGNGSGVAVNGDATAMKSSYVANNHSIDLSEVMTHNAGANYTLPVLDAYLSVNEGDVTGDGTAYTIPFASILSDSAGLYSGTPGKFTIQKAGWYDLNVCVETSGASNQVTGAVQLILIRSSVSSTPTVYRQFPFVPMYNNGPQANGQFKFASGDQFYINVIANGSSKTINVLGSASGLSTRLTCNMVRPN